MPESDLSRKEIKTQRVRKVFVGITKKMILEQGIEAVSVRKVADEAGYTVATVYNHFEHADELLSVTRDVLLNDLVLYLSEKTRKLTEAISAVAFALMVVHIATVILWVSTMTGDIYYFSGTGNTLYAAKYLADKTGASLIPMSNSLKSGETEPRSDCIGIVFPTYFASNKDGVPLIVKRSIKNLKGLEDKYIFAVCTCGYMPGTTIGSLAKKIKGGGKLAAGFTVNMAQGSLKTELKKKARQISEKDKSEGDAKDKNIQSPEEKLDKIAEKTLKKESAKLETRGIISKILNVPLRALVKPIFLKSRHFFGS
jgi:flavodoxin